MAVPKTIQTPKQQLKLILENTNDFIMIADAKGVPFIFNEAYANIMNALLGIEMAPAFNPTSCSTTSRCCLLDALHGRVLGGESFSAEFTLQSREGRHGTSNILSPRCGWRRPNQWILRSDAGNNGAKTRRGGATAE